MNGVPITALMPFVVLVVVIAMVINGRRMRSRYLADNPQFGLGAIAQRLGLQFVSGDPAYNLLVNDHDMRRSAATPMIAGMTGNTQPVEARAVGQHRGHPVEFTFYDQTRVEKGVIETTFYRTYNCVVRVGVNAPVPPFEIVLRNENEYLVTERLVDAPEQRFGHPAIDPTLVLRSPDPRVGPAFAPVVGALMPFGYVHVVGGDGAVRFTFTAIGAPTAMYYVETVLQVLLGLADVLEGRPAVPVPPPAPPPPR